MKLGISTNAFGRYGDNKYNKMKEGGFDYADIPFDGALGELTEEEYIECALREKALANAAGITVHQVHGPWIHPPQDSTPESRRLRAELVSSSKSSSLFNLPLATICAAFKIYGAR